MRLLSIIFLLVTTSVAHQAAAQDTPAPEPENGVQASAPNENQPVSEPEAEPAPNPESESGSSAAAEQTTAAASSPAEETEPEIEAEAAPEPSEVAEAAVAELDAPEADAPDAETGAVPPTGRTDVDVEAEEEAEETPWYVPSLALAGEFRFRLNAMGDIPLHTEARTELPPELGQNYWANTWLRLTATLNFQDTVKIIASVDLADGMLFGQDTQGVDEADRPRNGSTAFSRRGFESRSLYLEWVNPLGVIRAGLQPSHWGLGILANDGAHEPVFGDYRFGNTSLRFLFGSRPFGRSTPFNLVLAGDVVYHDALADLTQGERALQGVLAAFYGDPQDDVVGAYIVRRSERRDIGVGLPDDELDVWAIDLYGRTEFEDPTGAGKIVLAFEGVHVRGTTSFTRTADRAEFDVSQWMWAAQAGRTSDLFDVFFEGGYTSGDSNSEDGVQQRATMNPDHRIGLIMFPEMIAWQTARSATLARHAALVGRPSPGSDLLPSNGGINGAAYLYNWWIFRPADFMDVRLGWVWGRATADVVDVYRQRSQSRNVAYLGGDSSGRGLGFEIDASAMFHVDLPHGVRLQGGVEGGLMLPGSAFNDAAGESLGPLGLVRARLGFIF